MKAIAVVVLVSALCALFSAQRAQAAVTCIENKTTGKFEEKVGARGRMTGECDAQAAMNLASSVADMEEVSAAGGTKIIDGVIVTNAPKMALAMMVSSSRSSVGSRNYVAPAAERPTVAQAAAAITVTKPVPVAAITAAPIAAASALPVPAAVVKVEQAWEVRADDATIYGVLKRWSKTAGMQLMWETEKHDFRVGASATYRGSFDTAVFKLMESLEHSDYPIRACIYDDNGAVRIIHAKKSCKG